MSNVQKNNGTKVHKILKSSKTNDTKRYNRRMLLRVKSHKQLQLQQQHQHYYGPIPIGITTQKEEFNNYFKSMLKVETMIHTGLLHSFLYIPLDPLLVMKNYPRRVVNNQPESK
jgi:hypothetical protein